MMRVPVLLMLLAVPGLARAEGPAGLAAALQGRWQSVGAASEGGMIQTIHAVTAPALGEHALYLQMNRDDGEGAVTRQRLFILEALEGGGVAMHFPALGEAGRFVDGWQDPALFANLEAGDLDAYPESCAVHWHLDAEAGWTGTLAEDRCRIVSRHDGGIRIIRARFTLKGMTLTQLEQGFDADGTRLFGGEVPYRFERVAE